MSVSLTSVIFNIGLLIAMVIVSTIFLQICINVRTFLAELICFITSFLAMMVAYVCLIIFGLTILSLFNYQVAQDMYKDLDSHIVSIVVIALAGLSNIGILLMLSGRDNKAIQ